MDTENKIAEAHIEINADADNIWNALIDPQEIKKYMFGAKVTSNWEEGGDITWEGEMNGKPYKDKGKVIQLRPAQLLQYTHFSPLANVPDTPENYHSITIELTPREDEAVTKVSLSQDNNKTDKEKDESQKNWQAMLQGLKKVVEESDLYQAP